MSTVQSQEGYRHVITLSQSEIDVCQSIEDYRDGIYSCKSCASRFGSTMKIITHDLTNCDEGMKSGRRRAFTMNSGNKKASRGFF